MLKNETSLTWSFPIVKLRKSLFDTAAVLGLLFASMSAWADAYTAFDIGTLGGPRTIGLALNDSGQVAGASYKSNSSSIFRPFLTGPNGAGMSEIQTPAGDSWAFGINSSGQVTGSFLNYQNHAFVTGPNGVGVTDLGAPLGNSIGRAINNNGQVAGLNEARAFITGGNGAGGMTDIGALGPYNNSDAYGINANGQVVGLTNGYAFITGNNGVGMRNIVGGASSYAWGINASGRVVGAFSADTSGADVHAFITGPNGIGLFDLGTFGGLSSNAWGINSAGQVVGWAFLPGNSVYHAFVTSANGVGMTDLNSLVSLSGGDYFQDARAINDRGQIVVMTAFQRTYLLTPTAPVPEPETYSLFLFGLCLLGTAVRRRRSREKF